MKFACLGQRGWRLGVLGDLREYDSDVYKRMAFISKIKIEENESTYQFKTIRYLLDHAVWNYKLNM